MDYPEFSGRTAFITGGGSGIGALSGKNLARQGANVVLCDVNEEAVSNVAAEINAEQGGRALPLVVDIRRYEQVEAAANKAIETFGSVDILLNCAGGMSGRCCNHYSAFRDMPIEVIDWGLDVNLRGAIYCARAVIGGMLDRKRGVIINFGSVTGEGGGGGCDLDYACEKSAMHGLTKSLALCGASAGVRSCCIVPGPVMTRPGMASMKTLLGHPIETQEVVDLILYLCSDHARCITGSSHVIDAGKLLLVNG